MSDEQPVRRVRVAGGILPQRHLQKILPQLALDRNGGMIAILVVRAYEKRRRLFQQVAVHAQMPRERLGRRNDVARDGVYDVVEILAQAGALSRALEYAGRVARDGQNVVADVAFQAMLPVGEDAVLYAPSGFDGGQEILVQLFDIRGVGRAANHDVALEFDVGVADFQVDALNGSVAGRDFGVNLALVLDNARSDDEIAPGVAYVVLAGAGEMAFEQFAEVIHGGIVLAR